MDQAKALLSQLAEQAGIQTPGGNQHNAGQQNVGQQGAGGIDLQGLMTGPGGLATGALAGGLAGLLLGGKKPRKLAKSALKVGGVALVGGLAYKAWRDWQANKTPATVAPQPTQDVLPPADSPFMPSSDAEEKNLSRVLMRAMIAAAKADGHVSEEERRRIADRLAALKLNAADMAFIDEELSGPLDIDTVAKGAACPEQAAEIYAASLLVVDPNGAAERGYLAMLAARLNLDPGLVQHLHANAGALVDQSASS